MIALKYLSNSEINLDLNCPKNCVIAAALSSRHNVYNNWYKITQNNSIQDNSKLFEQLKSVFNRTISQNKHQWKISTERQNKYLNYLIDPCFQGVNIVFVLSFEDETQRISYKRCYLPTAEIKHYNVMIDGQNSFDQPLEII